jgi:apolipoprotein N-acyltransferase
MVRSQTSSADLEGKKLSFWGRFVPVLFTSIGVVLAFPPFSIYPFIFISLTPLFYLVLRSSGKAAFGWGWLAGFLITGGGFYFIYELMRVFGGMSPIPASLVFLLFSLFQGVGFAFSALLLRQLYCKTEWPVVFIAPLAWVVTELVCRKIFIFPWLLGNATYDMLYTIQIADLFGGLGVSALVVFTNALIYQCYRTVRESEALGDIHRELLRYVALAALVWGGTLLYGQVRIAQIDRVASIQETLRVGLVEADIGIFQKADPREVRDNLLIHQRYSAELEAEGVDLIVWPETGVYTPEHYISQLESDDIEALHQSSRLSGSRSVPRDVTFFHPSDEPLVAHASDDLRLGTVREDRVAIQRAFHTPLLFGVLSERDPTMEELAVIPPHRNRVAYNSAVLIDGEGRVLGMYDKNVRLVFGEYVPFATEIYKWFNLNVIEMIPTAPDIWAGESPVVLELPLVDETGNERRVRIGGMVCYEDLIAEYSRELALLGPNIFVNIINDAWFGESAAAEHHMAFSLFRSVEHRLPMVRATNTGISSIVDPVGRIMVQSSMTDPETLIAEIPVMPQSNTVYSRFGDFLGWIGLVLMIWGLWVQPRLRSKD